MNTRRPAITLMRTAGFDKGYLFSWAIDCAYDKPGPRVFTIYESNTPDGPWKPISPTLTDVFVWEEHTEPTINKRRWYNRDDTKYFRVGMVSGGDKQYSPPIANVKPTDRRRELIAAEIMRREALLARVHTGVKGNIYLRNRDGAKCTACSDVITGAAMQGDFCPVCGGTNQDPPYYGPYPAWFTFTNTIRHETYMEGGVGRIVPSPYNIRIVSPAQVRSRDILEVKDTKLLYYVDKVQVTAEVSTSPVIQEASVNEIPTVDPMYTLHTFNHVK